LAPDINVFFGLNGSGKTSLLKLLHGAVVNRSDLVSNVPFDAAEVSFYSEGDDRDYTRSLERAEAEEDSNTRRYTSYAGEFRQAPPPSAWRSKPTTEKSYQVTFLPTMRLANVAMRSYATANYVQGFEVVEATLDDAFATEVLSLWRRYTNRLLSDVRTIQESGLSSILQSLFNDDRGRAERPGVDNSDERPRLDAKTAYALTSGFMRRQGARAPATLASFRLQYDQDARLRSVVDDINQTERRIAVAERPRRQLEQVIETFITGGKRVVFTDRDITVEIESGKEIPLTSLSSGEKQLVRILLETITAGSSSIIIDEPELSLHVDWQKDLLASLRVLNPEAQIVVATHSPEIMADVADEKIYRL
jgi:energy-coupling factor transporter ATP-binding protein EcfA2